MAGKTTTTDYGICAERVSEPGIWGSRACGRTATDRDGMCGPHRAGKKRSDASRAKWDAEWAAKRETDRIECAQAAYAAAWRDQHPNEVYGETWPCPLCAQVLQPLRGHFYGVGALVALADQHKANHGPDWLAYEALAAGAERATGDGGGEG